jgi:hypothetical protein
MDDKLNVAMMILGTRMARNDSGLRAFSFPSSIMPLSFLNRLESGNGSCNVSLKKMVPTSQAIINIAEEMAQGKK